MRKKIIITETQYKRLTENRIYTSIVKEMKEDLDMNYEAIEKFVREGGEYFQKPMIKVKTDEEVITPKSLYEYLKYKYKMGEEFTKQVIRDWVDGKITEDYRLSKNIAMQS
jgi:hypothetical protein